MSKIPGLAKSQSVTNPKQTADSSVTEESKDESSVLSQSSSLLSRKSSLAQPKGLKTPSTAASVSSKEDPKLAQKEEGKTRPTTARPNEKKDPEPKARPATAKPAAGASSIQATFKPLETGDFDDPIAQAMHARVKIGGNHEAVIKDTDARKVGVQLVKTFKLASLKGPDLIELIN